MKPKSLDKAEKKLIAEIDKEMNLPRLTESVREETEGEAAQPQRLQQPQ